MSYFKIPPLCLLYFVLLTTVTKIKQKIKNNKTPKNPTEKLFQGIKSFGLDRIIDIWTLLQPEEERKRREYPPCCVGWTQAPQWQGGGGWADSESVLVCSGGAGVASSHQQWDAGDLLFSEAPMALSRPFSQESKFLSHTGP